MPKFYITYQNKKNKKIKLSKSFSKEFDELSDQVTNPTIPLILKISLKLKYIKSLNSYYYIGDIFGYNINISTQIYLFGNNLEYPPLILTTLPNTYSYKILEKNKNSTNTQEPYYFVINKKNSTITCLRFITNASQSSQIINFNSVQLIFLFENNWTTITSSEIKYKTYLNIPYQKAFITKQIASSYIKTLKNNYNIGIVLVQNSNYPIYKYPNLYQTSSNGYPFYLTNVTFNPTYGISTTNTYNNINIQTPLQYSCFDFIDVPQLQTYVFQLIGQGGNGCLTGNCNSTTCSIATGAGAGAYSEIIVKVFNLNYKLSFFSVKFSETGNPVLNLLYKEIKNPSNTIEYIFNIGNGGDAIMGEFNVVNGVPVSNDFPSLITYNGSLSTLEIINKTNGISNSYLTTNYNAYNNFTNNINIPNPTTTLNGENCTPILINGLNDGFVNVTLIEGYNGGCSTIWTQTEIENNESFPININAITNGYTISGAGQLVSSTQVYIAYSGYIYNINNNTFQQPESYITLPLNIGVNNIIYFNNYTSCYYVDVGTNTLTSQSLSVTSIGSGGLSQLSILSENDDDLNSYIMGTQGGSSFISAYQSIFN